MSTSEHSSLFVDWSDTLVWWFDFSHLNLVANNKIKKEKRETDLSEQTTRMLNCILCCPRITSFTEYLYSALKT